jgi:hypothetical protein
MKPVEREWRVTYVRRGRNPRIRHYQRRHAAEAFARKVRQPWAGAPPIVAVVVEQRPVGRWRKSDTGGPR